MPFPTDTVMLKEFQQFFLRALIQHRLEYYTLHGLDLREVDQYVIQYIAELGITPPDDCKLHQEVKRVYSLSKEDFRALPETKAELNFDADFIFKRWAEEGRDLIVLHQACFNSNGDLENPSYIIKDERQLPDNWGYLCSFLGKPCYVFMMRAEVCWKIWARGETGHLLLIELRKLTDQYFVERYQGKSIDFHLDDILLKQYCREDLIYPARLSRQIDEMMVSLGNWFKSKLVKRWGYLLIGKPGTGKTTVGGLVAAARPTGCTFLYVPASAITRPRELNEAFRYARLLAPTIMQIDDVDLVAIDRRVGGGSLTSTLMENLDGLENDAKIFLILTTNHPKIIDKAITKRAGRISGKIIFEGYGECLDDLLRVGRRKFSLKMDDAVIAKSIGTLSKGMVLTPDEAINVCERLHLLCGDSKIGTRLLSRVIREVCEAFQVEDDTDYLGELPSFRLDEDD